VAPILSDSNILFRFNICARLLSWYRWRVEFDRLGGRQDYITLERNEANRCSATAAFLSQEARDS
jgi:hypothetical protein